jgi:ribosomal protein L40E
VKRKTIIAIILCAAAIIAIGVQVYRMSGGGESSRDFPDGFHYVCAKGDCKHEFTISKDELIRMMEDEAGNGVICPKCGAGEAIRAVKCPNCGRNFQRPRGGASAVCPVCKKPLPKATAGMGGG